VQQGVVIIACARGAGGIAGDGTFEGAPVYPVSCAGSLHSSVVELLIRGGAAGVLVLSCPTEDCWNREGPKWLEERFFNEREAELQERVDRRRVRVAALTLADHDAARAELADVRARITELDQTIAEDDIDLLQLCEVAEETEPGVVQ
jgi:coenzyme F420-reducing hydrogenase delta subunit